MCHIMPMNRPSWEWYAIVYACHLNQAAKQNIFIKPLSTPYVNVGLIYISTTHD